MAHSGTILFMRTVPGKPELRALTLSLECKMWDGTTDLIPAGFSWDGNSIPFIFRGLFPRHDHPLASIKHDYRCSKAKNTAQRAWSDLEFQADVGTTGWWITKKIGYIGVRIGAFLGIGSNF